jgi:hypothetical protein
MNSISFGGVSFIDRPLKNNEKGHYKCETCGQTFTAEGMALHRGRCKG